MKLNHSGVGTRLEDAEKWRVLRLFRNGTLHYQLDYFDSLQVDFVANAADSARWAREFHSALDVASQAPWPGPQFPSRALQGSATDTRGRASNRRELATAVPPAATNSPPGRWSISSLRPPWRLEHGAVARAARRPCRD